MPQWKRRCATAEGDADAAVAEGAKRARLVKNKEPLPVEDDDDNNLFEEDLCPRKKASARAKGKKKNAEAVAADPRNATLQRRRATVLPRSVPPRVVSSFGVSQKKKGKKFAELADLHALESAWEGKSKPSNRVQKMAATDPLRQSAVVEVVHAGQSYKPSAEAYKSLIEEAHSLLEGFGDTNDGEIQGRLDPIREALRKSAIASSKSETETSDAKRTLASLRKALGVRHTESDTQIPLAGTEDGIEEEGPTAADAVTVEKKTISKKSKTQRNKEARLDTLSKKKLGENEKKSFNQTIFRLKSYMKEINKAEENTRAKLKQKKQARAQEADEIKQGKRPLLKPRSTAVKKALFNLPDLPDRNRDSLRRISGAADPISSRADSIIRRGLIPAPPRDVQDEWKIRKCIKTNPKTRAFTPLWVDGPY